MYHSVFPLPQFVLSNCLCCQCGIYVCLPSISCTLPFHLLHVCLCPAFLFLLSSYFFSTSLLALSLAPLLSSGSSPTSPQVFQALLLLISPQSRPWSPKCPSFLSLCFLLAMIRRTSVPLLSLSRCAFLLWYTFSAHFYKHSNTIQEVFFYYYLFICFCFYLLLES